MGPDRFSAAASVQCLGSCVRKQCGCRPAGVSADTSSFVLALITPTCRQHQRLTTHLRADWPHMWQTHCTPAHLARCKTFISLKISVWRSWVTLRSWWIVRIWWVFAYLILKTIFTFLLGATPVFVCFAHIYFFPLTCWLKKYSWVWPMQILPLL